MTLESSKAFENRKSFNGQTENGKLLLGRSRLHLSSPANTEHVTIRCQPQSSISRRILVPKHISTPSLQPEVDTHG